MRPGNDLNPARFHQLVNNCLTVRGVSHGTTHVGREKLQPRPFRREGCLQESSSLEGQEGQEGTSPSRERLVYHSYHLPAYLPTRDYEGIKTRLLGYY